MSNTLERIDGESRTIAVSADPFGAILDSNKFQSMVKAAELFARSVLVPKHFQGKPADVFVIFQMAYRLGVDPFTALQNTFVVGGKPGMSATLAIALANQRGPFAGPITYQASGQAEALSVTASALIRATSETVSATVDMSLAKAEGWTRNDKYRTMPEHMLTYRAATWLIRRYCPEVLMGLPTADELRDIQAATATSAEVAQLHDAIDVNPEPAPEPPAMPIDERLAFLHAMEGAPDTDALAVIFGEATTAAKAAKDRVALEEFITAKDAAKARLLTAEATA